MSNLRTKKITTLGMLSALAFLSVFLIRIPLIPAVPFLKYEPKDVIVLMAGFIFGPLSAIMVSVVVSFVELVTISSTGIIGFVMNILSTVTFVVPAAYLYKRKRTFKHASIGMLIGAVATTITMLLWNYLLTPIYMNVPLEKVIPLLTSAILPFNLIKSALNSILALLLYKPLVNALRKANLIEREVSVSNKTITQKIG